MHHQVVLASQFQAMNVSFPKSDWCVVGSIVERYMDKMSLFLLPDGFTTLFSFHHFIFIKLFLRLHWMNKPALCYLHYLLLLQKLWSGNPQINQHKYSINLFRVHITPQYRADPRPRCLQQWTPRIKTWEYQQRHCHECKLHFNEKWNIYCKTTIL